MRPDLASFVAEFQKHGRETAVVSHRGVRRYATSYEELAQLAGCFSAELLRRKITPGDRVILWGENSAEWIGAFFGCLLRGVLVVPLDASGSSHFAENVIREVNPRLLVTDSKHRKLLATDLPTLDFADLSQNLPPTPDYTIDPGVTQDAPFQIIFTSGTTSEPKGIVHTHRNVLANLHPIETEIDKYRRYERWVHPLRFLHTLPCSHVFGQFMGLWIPALLGAELHFVDTVESHHMIRLIRRERISVLVAVPRIADLLRIYLLSTIPFLKNEIETATDLSVWKRWWRFRAVHRALGWKFWAILSGGAPLSTELENFWNRLGFALIQGYGMTETAALITLNHPFRRGHGTIGKALHGSAGVKLSDTGELLVRGDMVSDATWQDGTMHKHATEWFATGDLAEQNESGEYRFLGRKGESIVTSSGLNIFPIDLEAAMLQQPQVQACAVVSCDLSSSAEPVCVVIFNGSEAALQIAVKHANERLAEFQQIRRVLRWPQLTFPYTSTGKLLKRHIRQWACSVLAGQSAGPTESNDTLLAMISSLTGEASPAADESLRLSEDLHLDSLGRVQLASMIEQRTGLLITDTQAETAKTLGDLRRILNAPITSPSASIDQPAEPQQPVRNIEFETPPAAPSVARHRYPSWPWSPPVQLLRVFFLEAVVRPLVTLLLAPRVTAPSGPLSSPMLIIANHVTALDASLVLYALPPHLRRRVSIAMSAELLLNLRSGHESYLPGRPLGRVGYWLVTALFNVFPLPRHQGFRESFAHAGEAIDRNYSILIFPEGTRSQTGQLAPFRQGIGLLVLQTELPVLPVALIGLDQIRSRERRWFRSGAVQVKIGDPIVWGQNKSAPEWTRELEEAIRKLQS